MKFLIILLALAGVARADTSKWLDFRVRFSPVATGVGVDSFFPVAKELSTALEAGWVLVNTSDYLLATAVCLSPADVRVCPLYDNNGFIAGLMLAVPSSDLEGSPYDFDRHDVFEKKLINGELYLTSTYYIVDPVDIWLGGRPSAPTFGEGLWIKHGNRYAEVPTDVESIKNSTAYTWHNCIPNMGIHYYYNMTPTADCDEVQPFFLLVKDGNLIGLGWQIVGKTEFVDRNWYETITGQAVKTAVPLAPACLAERADKYGVISVHMYLVENAWAIPCNQETESVIPIPGLP